jgi:hypothetical protein
MILAWLIILIHLLPQLIKIICVKIPLQSLYFILFFAGGDRSTARGWSACHRYESCQAIFFRIAACSDACRIQIESRSGSTPSECHITYRGVLPFSAAFAHRVCTAHRWRRRFFCTDGIWCRSFLWAPKHGFRGSSPYMTSYTSSRWYS